MRKPSRAMPPAPTTPMTGAARVILIGFCLAFVVFVYFNPISVVILGAIALMVFVSGIGVGRRMADLAADRQGESICTFARSFDCRAVDTWIIRAVFEEIQANCTFGRRSKVPIRRIDDLENDLLIDQEIRDELAVDIAFRAGRSLVDCENNPFYSKVKTVSDLVMFLMHQPRLLAQ